MQKILDSGAVLELSICSFAEGTRLMKTVAKEIKNTQINLGGIDKVTDFFQIKMGNEALNTLKNIISSLLSSDEIEAALFPCIERGTYTIDGITRKINRDLFEEEKARADYLPILKEALVFNLAPFFKNVKSLVRDIPQGSIGIQK